MVSSFDGQYLFTAGGTDASVNMWKVNAEYDSILSLSLLQNLNVLFHWQFNVFRQAVMIVNKVVF